MKRIITLLASLALVAGGLAIVPASAAETGELKLFLGSTGCPSGEENVDFLTTTDADSGVECFYTASGVRNEIGSSVATPVTPSRENGTRYWDTIDGGPVVLDASRPVTGEIFTSGAACLVSGACSPAGVGVGEVILDITLVGLSGGEEVELGTQTESFTATPGAPHATEVEIQPDAGLTGTYEAIELRTWLHGKSVGHGVVKTNGDASSFISIPTASGSEKKTPPGKNDPPGKKKGCDKGKGKKRGCEGKGKKSPEPGAACAAFTPGEAGTDKPTVTVTDAASEEKPLEQTVTLGQSTADITPTDPTYDYFNVVVDSKAAAAGLYATFEFPTRRDYDLDLLHTDGSYAARSHGFNPIGEAYAVAPLNEGHGGQTTDHSESLVGITTQDCGGWTVQTTNWLGEGGEFTVKLWLGEAQIEPQAEGEESP